MLICMHMHTLMLTGNMVHTDLRVEPHASPHVDPCADPCADPHTGPNVDLDIHPHCLILTLHLASGWL